MPASRDATQGIVTLRMPFVPSLPDLPWYALAAIPLIVLITYTIFGATGFGRRNSCVTVLETTGRLPFRIHLRAQSGSLVQLRSAATPSPDAG